MQRVNFIRPIHEQVVSKGNQSPRQLCAANRIPEPEVDASSAKTHRREGTGACGAWYPCQTRPDAPAGFCQRRRWSKGATYAADARHTAAPGAEGERSRFLGRGAAGAGGERRAREGLYAIAATCGGGPARDGWVRSG